MRDDFGLPSGDDPAAYGGERSMSAWRWEFLRRRRDYQDDWTRFHADWQAQRTSECADMSLPPGVNSWREHFKHVAGMPGAAHREKYGVEHLVDPACAFRFLHFVFLSRAQQLREAARKAVPAHLRGYDNRFEAMHLRRLAQDDALMQGDIITTDIDLRQPIKPQIEHIETWAKQAQAELSGKPSVSNLQDAKWRGYLRVLDLERRGLTFGAIAAQIYPSERDEHDNGFPVTKKVRAAVNRAHLLQDTLAIGR